MSVFANLLKTPELIYNANFSAVPRSLLSEPPSDAEKQLGARSGRGLWRGVEGPESCRRATSTRGAVISALSGPRHRRDGESRLPPASPRQKLARFQVNFSLGRAARRRLGGAGVPAGRERSGAELDRGGAGRGQGTGWDPKGVRAELSGREKISGEVPLERLRSASQV